MPPMIEDKTDNVSYYSFTGRIIKITARGGILIDCGEDNPIWFPIKWVESPDVPELLENITCEIVIPEWLAKDKGVI